jgi:hypothetical protein
MLQCCDNAGIVARIVLCGPSSSVGVVHLSRRGSLRREA